MIWPVILVLLASAALAVEFPGPIPLAQDGTSLAVAGVRLAGADRDYMATGSGGGVLGLTRFNPTSGFYTVLHRLFVGGRVTVVQPWQGAEAPAVGLVVATVNPDRILLVRVNAAYPYLEVRAEIALAEDPGAVAPIGAGPLGPTELAVALTGVDRVVFVGRDGTGEWSVLSETATGDGPSSLVGTDLDGDGTKEVVVAQTGALSQTLGILRRQPDGVFALETVALPGATPTMVAVQDLDGDGRNELAVSHANTADVVFYSTLTENLVEVSRATLTFQAQVFHLDALADGSLGLFGASADRGLLEYSSYTGGMWQQREAYYPGCQPVDFGLADLDGDGLADLVTVGGDADLLTTMLGDERLGFDGWPAFSLDRSPGSFISDDLDGDGWQDLLVSSISDSSLSLARGTPDGSLSLATVSVALGFRPGYMLSANMDADPVPELVVLDIVAGELVVLDLSVSGELTVLSRSPVGSFPYYIATGDLDGDQAPDLLVLSQDQLEVAALFGAGDGTVAETVNFGFPNTAHWIAPIDLNDDGLLDLAATDAGDRVWVMSNSGGREFVYDSFVNADIGALHMAVGDLDGDLDDDLVVANRGANSLSFFENDGTGILVRRIGGHSLPGQPAGLLLDDFDRDGRLDVLVNLHNDAVLGLIYGGANWNYSLALEIPGGPNMTGVVAVDYNLDGALDILTLDRTLQLGMTIVNHDPTLVAVAPNALTADCHGEMLELRIRPDRPGPWSLELSTGTGWRPVVTNGHAAVGELEFDRDVWILRLAETDRTVLQGDRSEALDVRLTVGEGADREMDTRTINLDCGTAPSTAPPSVAWQRQPWPNPFNPTVYAAVSLGRAGPLLAAVYDLAGHRVATLAEGEFAAGTVGLRWDGTRAGLPVGAGVYLLRVETAEGLLHHKLMLLK